MNICKSIPFSFCDEIDTLAVMVEWFREEEYTFATWMNGVSDDGGGV